MADRFDPPRNSDWQSLPMRPDIAGQYVHYSDLAAARAENKRLKRELEITHNSRNELAETWKDRAIKAEAERDEALALLADAYGAGTGGSVIEAHLAEAERDMRQRAADIAREAWRDGYDATPHILALPLKHADREGGAALAQGQKEGE